MDLAALGWKSFFQQQVLDLDEHLQPARIIAVQRSGLTLAPPPGGHEEVPVGGRWFQLPADERPTVGDWVMVDPDTGAVASLLERVSVIKRLAPSGEVQLIATNIDTAFLVTSCNDDFSPARLERYLAAVMEAMIQPVIVLTKIDQIDDVSSFVDAVRALGRDLPIETVNALEPASVEPLLAWCPRGQTIALLGSSGVGKSTIVNTMAGEYRQETRAAREADAKGRHTTTHRSLHLIPDGGVILDSPGMREFQITDVESGVGHVFDDIEELALTCRFNDCGHESEPGCAIRAAIDDGSLDERRLASYRKLQREDLINTETIAERHARVRQFARMVRQHVKADKRR